MSPQATARGTTLGSPDHRHRDRPVGTRPVAKLAELVVPPAVRRPARHQATCHVTTRNKAREGESATHRHRGRPVSRIASVAGRPVAKLAVRVVPPAVRSPASCQAAGVM